MNKLKDFLKTKEAKRFGWSLVNTLMGMGVSLITYLASDNVEWAIFILPIVIAFSQLITKYINSK